MTTKQNKGFTLLEILLVIATIGILVAIVLVAINPNRQLAQVRNAQRRSDINTIYKALEQYLIDTENYPNSVNSNFKEICNTGTEQVGGATDCSGKADLRVLVPTYLAAIPSDPSGGEYRVGINGNNKIAVYTVGENNQIIAINFAITNFGIIDVDALNYITAVETADGQALEDNVKTAINDFIIGLKTDGIWEPIKSSTILVGARTLSGALVPLKGTAPTNFNFGAGDYNRKTGLKGNASTKYLNSNKAPNSEPQNDVHLSVHITQAASTNNTKYIGAQDISNHSMRLVDNVGVFYANINSNSGYTGPNSGQKTGFLGASLTPVQASTNQMSIRFDGSTIINNNILGNILTLDIFVFGRNYNGSINQATDARMAFYSIGGSLNLDLLDARVTALVNVLAGAIP